MISFYWPLINTPLLTVLTLKMALTIHDLTNIRWCSGTAFALWLYRVRITFIRGRRNQAEVILPWFDNSCSYFHNYWSLTSKGRSIFASHDLLGVGIFLIVKEGEFLK